MLLAHCTTPIAQITFDWVGEDFPFTEARMLAAMGNTRAALYQKAKEPLPDGSPSPMEAAIDILE